MIIESGLHKLVLQKYNLQEKKHQIFVCRLSPYQTSYDILSYIQNKPRQRCFKCLEGDHIAAHCPQYQGASALSTSSQTRLRRLSPSAWRKASLYVAPSYTREATRIATKCLTEGVFPSGWKIQKLLLLPGKPPAEPLSFRPICIIDGTGKLLEKLVS